MIGKAFYILKRWLLSCLLFFIFSCQSKINSENIVAAQEDSVRQEKMADAAFIKIRETSHAVLSGDLIVRTGRDYTSDIMRRLSQKDQTYSHCGIASWENDTLFVYHSIGGDFNPDQKIRRDTFSFYCNPYENKGFGVYRYNESVADPKKIIQKARQFFKAGVTFDMNFNLLTDDKMYCSEFVSKIIEQATAQKISIETTTLDHFKFIAIDNLFINHYCKEIMQTRFIPK